MGVGGEYIKVDMKEVGWGKWEGKLGSYLIVYIYENFRNEKNIKWQ